MIAAADKKADAGAPEITSEMIEAGAAEVATYSPHETTSQEVAIEVYRAMERVRRRKWLTKKRF